MKKYITKNIDETKDIGYNFAKTLDKKDIICLTGELGAGKTAFLTGIANYFNISSEVSSPTFTIVNEYDISGNFNISKLYHFDVYRLKNVSEFLAIGGTEYFGNSLCVIEWGEIIQSVLPSTTIYITIRKDDKDENIRYIDISGGKYENTFN